MVIEKSNRVDATLLKTISKHLSLRGKNLQVKLHNSALLLNSAVSSSALCYAHNPEKHGRSRRYLARIWHAQPLSRSLLPPLSNKLAILSDCLCGCVCVCTQLQGVINLEMKLLSPNE